MRNIDEIVNYVQTQTMELIALFIAILVVSFLMAHFFDHGSKKTRRSIFFLVSSGMMLIYVVIKANGWLN